VSGTSTDGYLQRFAGLCLERRWRVVSFDYWRLDYADCRDLDGAIKYLHRQYPSAPIVPVAFSAGGHLLVRYLSTVGRNTPIVAAATVSACGDLMEEYRRVCKQENSSYRRYLNSALCAGVKKHAGVDPSVKADGERIIRETGGICDDVYDQFIATLDGASTGARGGKAPEWLRQYVKDSVYIQCVAKYLH
jgi:predicted alpha/beta-fold hydrolase